MPEMPDKAKPSNISHRACVACRVWKVRCDGTRPRCTMCDQRDVACSYPRHERRPRATQSQVEALEAQVRNLQEQLREQAHSAARPPPSVASPSRVGFDSEIFTAEPFTQAEEARSSLAHFPTQASPNSLLRSPPQAHNPMEVGSDRHLDDSHLPDHGSGESPVGDLIGDGIVAASAISPKHHIGSGTFHKSSSIRFAWKLQASRTLSEHGLVDSSDQRSERIIDSTEQVPRTQRQRFLNDEAVVEAALHNASLNLLPQFHVARFLFSQYMSHVHPITPYLVEDEIRKNFETSWSSNAPLDKVWVAQLNMIFALGCLFHDEKIDGKAPLEDPAAAGEQFFYRAWGYILPNAFGACSVSFLQLLLLAVQYQQGTGRGNQCWLTVGHASRIALGLGLHVDSHLLSDANHKNRDLYRILWWGCYNLDRVSSLIYGRPMGIAFTPQKAHLGESSRPDQTRCLMSTDASEVGDTPSTYKFFFCSVRLYLLMDWIFDALRASQDARERGDDPGYSIGRSVLSTSCDHDSELIKWHHSLPDFLKFTLDFDGDELLAHGEEPFWLSRQRSILRLRFLGMRLLLHRWSILFLLKSREKRRRHRAKANRPSPRWPAVYSEPVYEVPSIGPSSPGLNQPDQEPALRPQSEEQRSVFEMAIARVSARICFTTALSQIEWIDRCRPLGLTGAWWWDLHYTFNSLCILLGVAGLQPEDHRVVVDDHVNTHQRAQGCIAIGFRIVGALAARGGPEALQSEKFLQKLHGSSPGSNSETWSGAQPQGYSRLERQTSQQPARPTENTHQATISGDVDAGQGGGGGVIHPAAAMHDPATMDSDTARIGLGLETSNMSEDTAAFGLDMMWDSTQMYDLGGPNQFGEEYWKTLFDL